MKTKDLTTGNILKGIILFTLPLMFGNLFQQLYNTVDSVVVGNYAGKAALAAVGASATIINALIGFFMGLSVGGSVAISQYFGAKDYKNLKKAVQSFFSLTVVLGIAFTFIGIVCSPAVLRLTKIPEDVMPEAVVYLRIYFYGIISVMLYNMGSAILRAVGDSKRPLIFLCVSALINVVLDLVFVINFEMGVAGVAWATLIAQTVSAILVMWVLLTTKDVYRLVLSDLRYHGGMTRKIFAVGFPVGIQQSITSLSNIIVQSYINAFGSTVMAGYTACMKVDIIIMLPVQSLALAVTTFVGQNVGAKKFKRAHDGTKQGILLSTAVVVPICILVFLFSGSILSFFCNDPDVVEVGKVFVNAFVPVYFVMVFIHGFAGALRGHGDAKAPMFIMLGCFVVLRQIMLMVGSNFGLSVSYVAWCFSVTWIVCAAAMSIYYVKKSKTFDLTEDTCGKSDEIRSWRKPGSADNNKAE